MEGFEMKYPIGARLTGAYDLGHPRPVVFDFIVKYKEYDLYVVSFTVRDVHNSSGTTRMTPDEIERYVSNYILRSSPLMRALS
jgi:hypothetical protein